MYTRTRAHANAHTWTHTHTRACTHTHAHTHTHTLKKYGTLDTLQTWPEQEVRQEWHGKTDRQ